MFFLQEIKSFLAKVFDKLKSLNQIKPVKNNIPSPQLFINSHTKLLGCIEDHRRESARHFRVQSDLDTSLYLVLTLDEQIQELLCVHYCFSEVCHQADQRCVPLVNNLQGKMRICTTYMYIPSTYLYSYCGTSHDHSRVISSKIMTQKQQANQQSHRAIK